MRETTTQLRDRLNREIAGRLRKAEPVASYRFVTESELRQAAQRAVDKFHCDLKEALGHGGSKPVKQKTICVDFDGVIADYSNGYQGADVFGDPLPGAADSLEALRAAGWKVIIHTTRKETHGLRSYLQRHGIPYDEINQNSDQPPGSNPGKPIADIYLDDRAVRFESWPQALGVIAGLRKSSGRILLKSHVHGYTPQDGTAVLGYEADRKRKAARRATSAAAGGVLRKALLRIVHPGMLLKSHIRTYVKKDGTVVREHDDARHARKLQGLVEKSRMPSKEQTGHIIRSVTKEEVDKIKATTGVDVTSYRHAITDWDIRHIFKEHGNAKAEEDAGQIAITDEDIQRIPKVLASPYRIGRATDTRGGNKAVVYEKRFSDGVIYYVAEIAGGGKLLRCKTMFKKKP